MEDTLKEPDSQGEIHTQVFKGIVRTSTPSSSPTSKKQAPRRKDSKKDKIIKVSPRFQKPQTEEKPQKVRALNKQQQAARARKVAAATEASKDMMEANKKKEVQDIEVAKARAAREQAQAQHEQDLIAQSE